MTWFSSTAVGDFRSKRKCLGTGASLLLLALFMLLTTPETSCRPHDEATPVDEALVVSDEYGDVDNVEFHHVKLVDGILQEDHPVIMYKEDFVSEDYDPSKNHTTPTVAHKSRKYKDIAQRRRRLQHSEALKYRALHPEKIYFDILSPTPIVVTDDVSLKNAAKAHVEVISLADDNDVNATNDESKQLLKKRPKKYHSRQRRSADEHIVRKRNPYYRHSVGPANSVAPSRHYLPAAANAQQSFINYAIPGEYYNGPKSVPTAQKRFGGADNNDKVIWFDYTPTRSPNRRPDVSKSPPQPLFPQFTTSTPVELNDPPAVEADANANANANGNTGANAGSGTSNVVETDSSPAKCVWAITGCCSQRDNLVRYSCFERYGCPLVFWDLNPCADPIRDRITNYLNEQFL